VTVLPGSCPFWSARYPIYYLPSCTYLPGNVYLSLTSYLHVDPICTKIGSMVVFFFLFFFLGKVCLVCAK
jgi:hypothetical protein